MLRQYHAAGLTHNTVVRRESKDYISDEEEQLMCDLDAVEWQLVMRQS